MTKKQAGTQKNIRFSDEDVEILDSLRAYYGGYAGVVSAGLKALAKRDRLSKAELLAELERRLKE